jgi:GrpB-like predicted nucleotidyltransferase (UPF0157 family)
MLHVQIVEYNINWPAMFDSERNALFSILGDVAVNIFHIGSTAVPGLAAKPIIDIMIEVSGLDSLDAHGSEFQKLGYEIMGEFGIKGRRYFRKGGDNRTHQIHAFCHGDMNIWRHLAFRNYLRECPEIAEQYANIKKNAARLSNGNLDAYCDIKEDFVKKIEQDALIALSDQQDNAADAFSAADL